MGKFLLCAKKTVSNKQQLVGKRKLANAKKLSPNNEKTLQIKETEMLLKFQVLLASNELHNGIFEEYVYKLKFKGVKTHIYLKKEIFWFDIFSSFYSLEIHESHQCATMQCGQSLRTGCDFITFSNRPKDSLVRM